MVKGNYIFLKIIIGLCLLSLTGCKARAPKAEQIQAEAAVSDEGTDSAEHISDNLTDSSDSLSSASEKDSGGNLLQKDGRSDEEDAKEDGRSNKYAVQESGQNSEEDVQEDKQSNGEAASEGTFQIPALPVRGSGIMDFVPEGWTLWDSVELDFNEDTIPDYVGVLDTTLQGIEEDSVFGVAAPRILFAIASDGAGRYRLDFQDINLIRTRGEGGVFGDPYEPLTAEGTSFTTHAYGGSAWRWVESDTYTYKAGEWYETLWESTYGYGDFTTSYEKNDWESGIGIRKKRSDDFDDMEKYWDSEDAWEEKFDVEYEVSLDEPPTLYQAGMRWWLAPERVEAWSVDSIVFSEGVTLSEEQVKLPEEMSLADYCDEDCVLYTFQDKDSSLHYLAMYCFQDRKLIVLAESDTSMEDSRIYKGKVYYSTGIVEKVAYKQDEGGQEQVKEEDDTVGISLNRMNLDGSGKESIFTWRYPGLEQEILESRLPYLSLIYEISGDEIIAEVYVGNESHPVCRMNCDGTELKWIGQIPAAS